MQCRNCREELPGGVAFCQNCGTPVTSPFVSSPNQALAPTMLASSPDQGVPPTVVAPMPGQPVPPGPANLYAPPPSTNYRESAPPPPINPYSAPPSSPYNPTGPYSAPYGAPLAPYSTPGTYLPPQQFAPIQQPPKKKVNGCIIALVIVLILLLLIGGGVVAAVNYVSHKVTNAVATANAAASAVPTIGNSLAPTATTGTDTGSDPTTSQIDATAATFITAAQTSSNIDSNGNPTDSKTSFSVGDTAYVSFTSSGQVGYSTLKLYRDGSFDIQTKVLSLDANSSGGDFSIQINNPGQFVAGVYWCTKSDCSDAALAQVVSFSAT